jgi:hypothetical protein
MDKPCPYCSFQPTNRADFCEDHRPKLTKTREEEQKAIKEKMFREGKART